MIVADARGKRPNLTFAAVDPPDLPTGPTMKKK
jgi:hypothetical protein